MPATISLADHAAHGYFALGAVNTDGVDPKRGMIMFKRPLMLLTAIATVTATLATTASAQTVELAPVGESKAVIESDSGSYIVVMEQDPVVVSVGQDGLDTPAAESLAEGLEADQDEVLEEIGADESDKINTYTNALNGFSAFLTYDEAQAIAADPKVAIVLPDELLQADTNSSPEYLGLTRKGGAYDSGLTGEDVVVGVIDNGIWPEHPSFADDGSYGPHPVQPLDTSRPSCEFGNTAHNADDVPFTCNNKLLGARQMLDTYRALIGADPAEYDSARDDDGHGTHTASTAAGNAGVDASMYGEDLGEISGIAPRLASLRTRASVRSAASPPISPQRSIRQSSTASTSSTTRSAAVPACRQAVTTSRSSSLPMPACSSRRLRATAVPAPTRSARRATHRGSPRSVQALSSASSKAESRPRAVPMSAVPP